MFVWKRRPLRSVQTLFTFYPDRLHKMKPKHLAKKSEGMVAACGIKSNLYSRLHFSALHPFLYPSAANPPTPYCIFPGIPRYLLPKTSHSPSSSFRCQHVCTCARNQIRGLLSIHKSVALSYPVCLQNACPGKLLIYERIYCTCPHAHNHTQHLIIRTFLLLYHTFRSRASGV